MKVDAHNSLYSSSANSAYGSHKPGQSQSIQASTQIHQSEGVETANKDDPLSTIKPAEPAGATRENQNELSTQDKKIIEQLKSRDREVRAHEAAHKSAAGSHARGGAEYTYQSGPDGKRYAIGGEVSIDTSKVADNPQATIIKAQIIYRAAMAPAQPSSQDRSVAIKAKQMEAQAQQELRQENNEAQSSTEANDKTASVSESSPPV